MAVSRIRKRDGSIVRFDQSKITHAIHRALFDAKLGDGKTAKKLSDRVVRVLAKFPRKIPSVEDVQDIVVDVLAKWNKKAGRVYQEFRLKKARLRETRARFGIEEKLTYNAMAVLEKRYLLRDEEGWIIETPGQMFRRVARTVASAERFPSHRKRWGEEFFGMMSRLEFLPNSPTLFNAGAPLGQLSACFVLPIEDSLKSIFEAVKQTALIEQSGGGVGFSFSRLRPKGDIVRSTKGVASGPVSFMREFDTATDVIKAGGKRRGAMMGSLRVDHPDILEFIRAKTRPGQLTNFNVSVAVTDSFMRAVKSGKDYSLVNPRTGKPVGKLSARKVWGKIIESAWKSGDPGVLFIDEMNRKNPTRHTGLIETTNPCGEVNLHPYESCNLGSINLTKMLARKGKAYSIDWEKLRRTVRLAVRFLDNVIDVNKYPLAAIAKATKANRRIGLGVMGFADMLIMLGIPYNSGRAVKIGERLMRFISQESHKMSQELGRERGSFPNFKGSAWHKRGWKRMRNATTTVIAPTGTLSIIAGCSSGIEPLLAVSYVRKVLEGRELLEVNRAFERLAKEQGFYSADLMLRIAKEGSVQGIKRVPADIRRLFVTALEIRPEWHVRMQAAFQKHTDNAVSKCVTGDSWIFTEKGLLQIKELYNGEMPDSFSKLRMKVADNPEPVYTDAFYFGGVQPVIKLETASGASLGGTPVHRIRVLQGGKIAWKCLSDIKEGDTVVIMQGTNIYGNLHEFSSVYGHPFLYEKRTSSKTVRIPYKITTDLARLLGYVISDGSYNVNSLVFTQEYGQVINDFVQIVKKRFGLRPKIYGDKRRGATANLSVNSRELVAFFRDYLGIRNAAEKKGVPKIILASGKEIQKAFIKGLT
ncbi:MAG: adenosylcobalamin-dependent ribonucleoside-diphosphate reductase, partial [Candidatus Aenigmatarchaeota archaeon]